MKVFFLRTGILKVYVHIKKQLILSVRQEQPIKKDIMSSVNDIMAVLLEAPTKLINNANIAIKPGRGRPAGRGNKQISSSITITSKPQTNGETKISINPRPAPSPQQQQMPNKQTNKTQQEAIGNISLAQISRLEKEFVKV